MQVYDSIDARRSPAPPMLQDSYRNIMSGLGTCKDKSDSGRFTDLFLGYDEMSAMYRSDWLAGAIVDAPADDMTREWRQWKGGRNQVSAIMRAERALDIRSKVNKALKHAGAFGGGAILVGVEGEAPETELDVASLPKGGIAFLHNLSRYEIFSGPMCRDPMNAFFGEPEYYLLGTETVGSIQIHPSRVIRFEGLDQLETSRQVDSWGDSRLQRVYDAVRDAAATARGLASMVQEAKVDVVSIPDLTHNALDEGYVASLLARFAIANRNKSINSMLVLDKEETYEQKKLSLTDLPKVLEGFLQVACGAAQIPATRLLGKSPGGLGSNGAGEIRHYYDMLAARQETEVSPAMRRLDRLLKRHALGAEPEGLDYVWLPLWQLSETERAVIELQQAQAAQVWLATGLLPFEALATAVQGLLVREATYPGFEDALQKAIAEGKQVVAPVAPVDDGSVVKNPSIDMKPAKQREAE